MSIHDDDMSRDNYGESEKSAAALLRDAAALRQTARWQEAIATYDQILARLDHESERDRELRFAVLYLKAACLYEQDDAQRTLATCDALLASYGSRDDQKAIPILADTLWLKSRALARRGDLEQERRVLQQLIERYRGEHRARASVARAMYNEGIHLRNAGRGEDAVQVWDELFAQFASDLPESVAFTPIRGQLAKSHYLAQTNRLDAALVTCEAMLQECARLGLPSARATEVKRTAHQCVGLARRSRSLSGRLRALTKRR